MRVLRLLVLAGLMALSTGGSFTCFYSSDGDSGGNVGPTTRP